MLFIPPDASMKVRHPEYISIDVTTRLGIDPISFAFMILWRSRIWKQREIVDAAGQAEEEPVGRRLAVQGDVAPDALQVRAGAAGMNDVSHRPGLRPRRAPRAPRR